MTHECLFLRHGSDRAQVRRIQAELAGLNMPVRTHEDELIAGRRRWQQFQEAIQQHHHIFLFWSASAAQCPDELGHLSEMAQVQHGSVIPVLLDATELPLWVRPYVSIEAVGRTPGELARIIAAHVTGRLPASAPQMQVVDIPVNLAPNQPVELIVLRLVTDGNVPPALWEDVAAWAAQERQVSIPLFVVGACGRADGWQEDQVAVALAKELLDKTAIILWLPPPAHTRGRNGMGPRAGSLGQIAIWAGQPNPVACPVLGAPDTTAEVGPQLPIFRTPEGFTLGVIAMALAAGEPDDDARTLAGVYADGLHLLCREQGVPERVDLCILFTPQGAWELAIRRLAEGVGPRPVPCTHVLTPAYGLFAGTELRHQFLEDGPCAYRLVYDPGTGTIGRCRYRMVSGDGRLQGEEEEWPLRQLIKRTTPANHPPLYRERDVQAAVEQSYTTVRRSLLDGITEPRRGEILTVLNFPDAHGGRGDGIVGMARALAALGVGPPVGLDLPVATHTARWGEGTRLVVLRGRPDTWADRTVADFISWQVRLDERTEFDVYGTLVVVLEHPGNLHQIKYYRPQVVSGPFEMAADLQREFSPAESPSPVRYCGLRTLESELDGCDSLEVVRQRLWEVS